MKPVVQALVLADHVYEDKATGKKIISGTFNRYIIQRKPPTPADQPPRISGGGQPGSPYVYVSLTDIKGSVPIHLRYVDLQNNNSLLKSDFQVRCDDPLQTVEIVIPLPQLPKPHAGVYALELLCENEPLGALRVTVEERTVEQPPESTDGDGNADRDGGGENPPSA